MTCIVADSGPLIMFGRSELLGTLRQVAGAILVPATVFGECTRETAKPGVQALFAAANLGSIKVEADPVSAPGLPHFASLDAGEIAALRLAHHLRCSILMDETLGRKVALRHEIPVIGSAGILLAAKERGLLTEIAPILVAWRGWAYFMAPALFDAVLSRAGEHR